MKFLFSSIGQKIQIAFSGICLAIFLLFHLFNNLVLFTGSENFNNMVGFLQSIHFLVRILEAGLLFIIILHVINAVLSSIKNRKSNNGQYAVATDTASPSSKTMIWSGLVILFFFFIHLRYFWYTFQTMSKDLNYFQVVLKNEFGFLGHTPTAIFYIISILLISSHLKHGFMSVFKTLGVSIKYRDQIIKYLAFIFWAIIPFGFILIVIAIQTGIIS
jgi:succinate dehydrogenase / fumarate reductase cytochrome b subunit